MGDIGIDRLKPRLEQKLIVSADTAYWEATYTDGTVLSEASGGTYLQIDRSRLSSFRIVHDGTIVFESFVPPGFSGNNLIYRRRTMVASGSRKVVFIIGWLPGGKVFVIDLESGSFAEDAKGITPTLMRMPGEPEDLLGGRNR